LRNISSEIGDITARARFKFLEKEEEDLIHEKSLSCLQEFGVLVRSPSVLKLLENSGAIIDEKTKIARIPENMVKEALEKVPKRIRLCARDSKHDMEIPVESIPYIATTGLAVYMTDLDSGEKRRANREDLAQFARLANALSGADFFWTTVVPMDVPEAAHTVHELWTSLQNTVKHVQQIEVRDAEDARTQIEIASNIVGGDDKLRRRPIFSAVCSPISPLTFGKGTVEAQVELAKAGIPVISMNMPLAGLASPVTLAGTITLVNVENLASLVISQSAANGAPFVYSSDSVPADMTTGGPNFGAPEVPLLMTGFGQMAKRYELPCMVGDWGFGDTQLGMKGSFSEMVSTALDTFSGTDLCSGLGSIDDAKGASLEQVVIDAYAWDNFRGFLRTFKISEETIALDVVKQVGHGNTFLTHPHTAKNFKKELFFYDQKKLAWEATLSTKMVPAAKEIVKRILKEHEVTPIDRDIVAKGDALIKGYEKKLVA